MTKLAQQRWADTQKRLESLEKQVKLLFKRTGELQVQNEYENLPTIVKDEMQQYAEALIVKRGLNPEKVLKGFDWILNFVDAHRDLYK